MNVRHILMAMAAAVLLCACGGGDYTPKPRAYLRIDMPPATYQRCDTAALPFRFDRNRVAEVVVKKNTPHEVWADIVYPQWEGVVFLSYKRLARPADLRGQTDTSARLMESHYQFASGVNESHFESAQHRVYGNTYHIQGNRVASTCQFWVTDSVRHFLRGALYLNRTPNNDSLAPVLTYLQADIDRLVESLEWR